MHAEPTTAGLLLSLQSCLPASASLAKRARRLANALAAPHGRRLEERATDTLAALLDATDTGLTFAESDCLDAEWDE